MFTQGNHGSTLATYAAGQTFGGWTVTSGNVDLYNTINSGYVTDHGGYSVDLDGSTPGAIMQTLSTIAGYSYTVTFELAGNFGQTFDKTMQISAAGVSQNFIVTQPAGWSRSTPSWNYQTFTFTATGSSTDLVFQSLDTSGVAGAVIGDVHVIQNTGDAGNYLFGGAGDDFLVGAGGNDTIAGGTGADTVVGGGGSDTASYSASASAVTVNLTTNVNTGGDAASDSLTGIENITGSAFNDTLTGDGNDNVLSGGAGVDTISGGAGNDTLAGGAGADTLTGGSGIDTADYSASASAVTVNLATNVNTGGDAASDSLVTIENVTGSAFNDTLTGDTAANVLTGGGGADTIAGGGGIDTASYSTSASAVTVNLATNVNTGGDAQGDSLTAMENLTGSDYNDTLTGDTGINVLSGGAGNDALAGGDGNDTLIGGTGSDTLTGGNGDDVLLAGQDIVYDGLFAQTPFDAQYDDWHHYESGETMGGWTVVSGSIDIVNSTFFATEHGGYQADLDSFTPGSIKQTLTTVVGHSYTVTFDLGGDFLGGDIIKTLQVSAAASSQIYTVTEQAGWSQSDLGFTYQSFTFTATATSTDLFFASLDSGSSQGGPLIANVHVLHTTADGGDTLSGGAGDDFLVGAGGNDTIAGGSGADTMVGGGGIDTADYSGATGAVTVDLSVATAQNTVNDGTDTVSGFENLTGSAYADTLTGDAGDNYLDGGAGNDTLSGGSGNDVIAGGAGNDTITGGSGTDTASYSGATSAVTVNLATATAQNTVGAGTDTLSGFENLTGSAYADTLTGDGSANVITGGTGNDTVSGAGGSDSFVYYMGDGNDTVTGGAAGGWTDSINLNNGTTALGTYGVDWTLSITSGSVSSTDTGNHIITLSQDAAGHIDLSNGATINFTELERITW